MITEEYLVKGSQLAALAGCVIFLAKQINKTNATRVKSFYSIIKKLKKELKVERRRNRRLRKKLVSFYRIRLKRYEPTRKKKKD